MSRKLFVITCGPNPEWVEPAVGTAMERQHELAIANPKHWTVRVTERKLPEPKEERVAE